MAEPRFPNAHVNLIGEDGNAFFIIGKTARELRKAGATNEEVQEFQEQATSGDYANVLRTVTAWVSTD